jgi:hypothetical protein
MNINNINKFNFLANNSCGMVYFAADEQYFNEHGIFLINSSITYNKGWFVHVHLYNPSQCTIAILSKINNVSFSFEEINYKQFNLAVSVIKKNPNKAKKICKTIKAHERNRLCGILSYLIDFFPSLCALIPQQALLNYILKTYYASQRFVILNELIKKATIKGDIISLDADSLFNKPIPNRNLHHNCDIAIKYRNSIGNQKFLAGAIFMPAKGKRNILLKNLADDLNKNFLMHEFEWGLDQFSLNKIVPQYEWENLNTLLCDLDFCDEAIIWLAKGNTKSDSKFQSMQNKFLLT